MVQEDNFSIKEIVQYNDYDLKGLNKLLRQWSATGYQMDAGYFKSLIKHSHVILLCDKKKVIGTVTLIPVHKLSGKKGSLEHLIVDEKYRGRGLGEKLMRHAIELAKTLNMETVFLTYEPDRVAAGSLYKKLGFKIKKTNFCYLHLKNGK